MEVARFLVLPVIVVLPLEATHKETQMHVDADCGAVAGADSDFGSTDLLNFLAAATLKSSDGTFLS